MEGDRIFSLIEDIEKNMVGLIAIFRAHIESTSSQRLRHALLL